MNEHQERAVRLLIEGLAHVDKSYTIPPDDALVMADWDYTSYELSGADGGLRLGHLRDLASIFTQEK